MPNKVYVINKHGRPLMPCSPAKARHLLDAGKAKVKKRTPFTIQLLFGSTGYTQEVILGVDAGSKTIGLSASAETEELLSAEVKPRNDVVDLLSTHREFRRARRNRKTRYRKPRFDNRVRSKHKGWLAPSVEVKIQEHITSIKRVCRILPVSKVVIETAEFDLQLLKAIADGKPVPQGEDYQKGEMYGHYNVRQYVLWRDDYTCQCCGAHATKKKRGPASRPPSGEQEGRRRRPGQPSYPLRELSRETPQGVDCGEGLQKAQAEVNQRCHIHGHHAEDFNAEALL